MTIFYAACVLVAAALASITLIPALIVAGVAALLVVRYELLAVAGRVAAIRAARFRPETARMQSPAEVVDLV